jgi:hypothetical protein
VIIFSEQDGSASGFAWVAREPELMCGAKGRASSLRSIDYHNRTHQYQQKPGGKSAPSRRPRSASQPLPATRSRSLTHYLDARKGLLDT